MPTIITRGAASAQGFGAFASLGASYFIGLLAPSSSTLAGSGIATDSSNNIYVIGSDYSGANASILLYKYNSSGVIQWQKKLSNSAADYGNAIAIDNSDNIYICGQVDISGSNDFFIAKYNSSGAVQWQRRLYGSSTDAAQKIDTDSSGNVYVIGYSTFTNNDVFLAKYNSSGAIQWQRRFYGTQYSIGYGITLDSSNNVYITGTGSFLTSGFNQNKIILAKYDTSGSLIWQYKLGPTTNNSNENGYSVATDSSGNIYLACDAQPAAGGKMQVAKYDSSGNIQWQRSLGPSSDARFASVATDSSSNAYFCGSIYDGTSYVTAIAKYDSSGNIQWQRKLTSSVGGTLTSNFGGSIFIDNLGNVCVSGYLNGTDGIGRSMVLKLPNDGSKTGTYTLGGITVAYAASSYTDVATTYTSTATTQTSTTPSLTDAATTLTESTTTYTATVTIIP